MSKSDILGNLFNGSEEDFSPKANPRDFDKGKEVDFEQFLNDSEEDDSNKNFEDSDDLSFEGKMNEEDFKDLEEEIIDDDEDSKEFFDKYEKSKIKKEEEDSNKDSSVFDTYEETILAYEKEISELKEDFESKKAKFDEIISEKLKKQEILDKERSNLEESISKLEKEKDNLCKQIEDKKKEINELLKEKKSLIMEINESKENIEVQNEEINKRKALAEELERIATSNSESFACDGPKVDFDVSKQDKKIMCKILKKASGRIPIHVDDLIDSEDVENYLMRISKIVESL